MAVWRGNPRQMSFAHRHLDLEINYVLHGTMTYLIGGAMTTLPLRRVCAIWGGVPHQLIHAPPASEGACEAIWATVPLTQVLGWQLPESLIGHLLGRGLVLDDEDRPGDVALLRQWMDDLRSGADAAERIVLLEMEARLRRLALSFEQRGTLPASSIGAKTNPSEQGTANVEAIARFLSERYREPIRVEDVAAAVHLHPNYAMTLFRRHTGMTISRYLTLQRVAHAQRLLATTRCSIVDAANESGFGSLSRFYEAFQQQTGCSPRQFRLRVTRTTER
ncbi:MAG: helix-turn-helix domain-containing protein [Armatimonadaceae bacterium]